MQALKEPPALHRGECSLCCCCLSLFFPALAFEIVSLRVCVARAVPLCTDREVCPDVPGWNCTVSTSAVPCAGSSTCSLFPSKWLCLLRRTPPPRAEDPGLAGGEVDGTLLGLM